MLNTLAVDYNYTTTTYNTTSTGSGSMSGAALIVIMLLYFAVIAIVLVAMWKLFVKAGQDGWKVLIPIYNSYIMLQIAGLPGWYLVLFFIPFVNLYVAVVMALGLAKNFGKSTAFGIFGLFLFSVIGYLILAFGDAKYVGTKPSAPVPPAAPVAA